MPRKKYTKNIFLETVWKFPARAFLLFFASLNVSFFILHRIIIFKDSYQIEAQMINEDTFVFNNICKNNTLKANLGQNYVDICHRAEVHSQKSPFINAVRHTIQNTYLCGDQPCIEIFEQVLEIVTRSLAWTLCAIMCVLFLTLCLIIYCSGSRCGRKWSKRHKIQRYDIEEQLEEPLQIQYVDYDYKKNV